MSDIDLEPSDSLTKPDEPKSSALLLEALGQSEKAFRDYSTVCERIDDLYSLKQDEIFVDGGDQNFQLFWASMEILKPAIYARPPVPVVAPRFKDRDPTISVATEMLERALVSTFADGSIDEVMLELRDDLALTNRGVPWVTYEADTDGDDDGQKVCIEHLDRTDFLHEPARKWADVGWVARRAWMTRSEMDNRFDGNAWEMANFTIRHESVTSGAADRSEKAGVWEVWSKTDEKVYWVTDGVATVLDECEPYMDLKGFFPCPRPAYGTRRRRTLVPVPDYLRYASTLKQITELTTRVYDLLREVKLRGFFPAGGDIGETLETLLADDNSAKVLIPVPAAAFGGTAGGALVQWIPLDQIATAITGLITARGQLIQDFYEISGISDIMRGATNAQETLGAQELKQRNGSIRIQDKVDELTRVAADVAKIAGEIMAEHFSQETLLAMSQMKVRTKAEIKKNLAELEKLADEELKALGKKAREAMSQQQGPVPPEQGQQLQAQFEQEQQAIIAKYQPQIDALGAEVPIENVMKMLRDGKTRDFSIEIETDSTILTDDMAEKSSRAEFLQAFNAASQSVMVLAQAGKAGAELGGGLVKFALAPFRVGREMDGLIDKFTEDAQSMVPQGDDGSEALAEAQGKLAEAEMTKAQAAMAKVEADTSLKQAEGQRKMMEAQAKAQSDQGKMQLDMIKLQQAAADGNIKAQEAQAKIDMVKAQTMKLLTEAGVMLSEQQLNEFNSLADIELRKNGQAMDATAQAAPGEAVEGEPKAKATTGTTQNAVMEGLTTLGQMLAEMGAAQAQQTQMLAAAIQSGNQAVIGAVMAPNELVRGPDGRAVGARKVMN